MTVLELRASALPLAFRCAGSLEPTEPRVEPINEAAHQGSAGHEVMRRIVEMDLKSTDDVDHVSIARMFSADEAELRVQAFVGVRLWKQLRPMFPEAQAEVELRADIAPGVVLTGHPDLFSLIRAQRRAHLADWKFGRVDGDVRHQLAAYSALVLLNYPDVDRVDSFAVRTRDDEAEPYSMDRVQLDAWLDDLGKRVLDWDGVYRPGDHCVGCRRAHSCPARVALVRADVEILSSREIAEHITTGLADLPDVMVVELRRKAKAIERVLESLDDAVKLRVEQAGGALSDGKGRELRFVETKSRKIDPSLAGPVLEQFLTDDEIDRCITVHASKLDDAVAAKNARGAKRDAIDELGAALRDAGAVTEVTKRRLEDRKKKGPT